VTVELVETISRNPELFNTGAADSMDLELGEERHVHLKTQDVPDVAGCLVLRVPVFRDLGRMCLAQHRIEDRLALEP
jgi:hypothetical protein